MRTTLTIDDDLAAVLKREAVSKGLSFETLVNDSIRKGLSANQTLPAHKVFKVRPYAMGFMPGIDPTKLNQLADELEAETYLEKQPKRANP